MPANPDLTRFAETLAISGLMFSESQPGQNRENLKNTCRFRLLAAYAAAQLHEESKESQKSSDSPISGLDRVAC